MDGEEAVRGRRDWRAQGNFGGDGYIHYFDYGVGFTSIYMFQNISEYQNIHFKYLSCTVYCISVRTQIINALSF